MTCWRAARGLPGCGEGADVLDTADVRQTTGHGCGAAAFDTLHRFHHGGKAPKWARDLPDPVRGIGPDTMELLVRRHFGCVVAGHLDVERLRLFARFTPVLVVVALGPESDHWVAVRGVARGRVYVQDPDRGRASYPLADWPRVWTDSTAGGAYARFAVTGWPAE